MATNTLLGYFKDGLRAHGESSKYLTREFLGIFITEYKESHKTGVANYEKTKTTKFYNLNSCGYCVFLSLYEDYQAAMDRLTA